MSVVIETTIGDLTVDLYTKERPKASLNFVKLCKMKKYNLSLFHMVQPNFIAQTGDPTGTGRGGESVFLELYGNQARYFEAESNPRIKHTKKGLVSMVNCGDNMLGSQFFITLADDLDYLDGTHCVFGEVVEGWDTIDKLNQTISDSSNRPYQDIRITHTVILHDPFDDPPGFEPRAESPEPTKEMLASSRIGADEDINDYAGKTEEEINELLAAKEARARATILEMVGDLPDADVAPPENVLFVCKLNPVTTDDDLEIIFSRFGKVKSCEVIRDQKTGDSLQYAFVEFEDQAACEQAYFKMDNVLIDDRRIHVDFSQSVSRYKWKGKGRLEVLGDNKGKQPPQGGRGKHQQASQAADQRRDTGRNKEEIASRRREEASRNRRSRSRSLKHEDRHRDRRRSGEPDRRERDNRDHRRHNEEKVERRRSRSRKNGRDDRQDRDRRKKDDEDISRRRRDSSRSPAREKKRVHEDDRREKERRRSRSRDRQSEHTSHSQPVSKKKSRRDRSYS